MFEWKWLTFLQLKLKNYAFPQVRLNIFNMSWGKVVINNAFYVFPSTGVKTFPQVELNRHMLRLNMRADTKIVVFPSIRQTLIFPIDVWKLWHKYLNILVSIHIIYILYLFDLIIYNLQIGCQLILAPNMLSNVWVIFVQKYIKNFG